MLKFTRYIWHKAQERAALDIILMAKMHASHSPVYTDRDKGERVVRLKVLESYIIEKYVKPSREDDNPKIEIRADSGISPNQSPAQRQR